MAVNKVALVLVNCIDCNLVELHRLHAEILFKCFEPGHVKHHFKPAPNPVGLFGYTLEGIVIILLRDHLNNGQRRFHLMYPLIHEDHMLFPPALPLFHDRSVLTVLLFHKLAKGRGAGGFIMLDRFLQRPDRL